MSIEIKSKMFAVETIRLGGTTEQVVRGGRDKFALARKAFANNGIMNVGMIGWGSQSPAQTRNIVDSLEGTGITTKVGLRLHSPHWEEAATVCPVSEMYEVIRGSDMVIVLIEDSAQPGVRNQIFAALRPGTTLGFSHGFLQGYMEGIGEHFPKNINVIGVCPKGMGPSVRRLYEQGKKINGAGINCSFAVEQDFTGNATEIALGWGTAIGAPWMFPTTLGMEWRSDLVGERCILLGGVRGIVDALYRYYAENGMTEEGAFLESVENITGSISKAISERGIIGLYQSLSAREKATFERIYSAAYVPFRELIREVYDEVTSGNEIRSVIMAGKRLKGYKMVDIESTAMWEAGKKIRAKRGAIPLAVDPFTAGLYCAAMMAQIDELIERGHCLSEVANESVIEATDSLLPFMHARGVTNMSNNCSITAQLGDRKWAPRFDYTTMQQILPVYQRIPAINAELIAAFTRHQIHEALAVCSSMRPPVSIAVE